MAEAKCTNARSHASSLSHLAATRLLFIRCARGPPRDVAPPVPPQPLAAPPRRVRHPRPQAAHERHDRARVVAAVAEHRPDPAAAEPRQQSWRDPRVAPLPRRRDQPRGVPPGVGRRADLGAEPAAPGRLRPVFVRPPAAERRARTAAESSARTAGSGSRTAARARPRTPDPARRRNRRQTVFDLLYSPGRSRQGHPAPSVRGTASTNSRRSHYGPRAGSSGLTRPQSASLIAYRPVTRTSGQLEG